MPTLSVLVACARHSTKPGGVAGGWGTGAHLVLQAGQGAVALRAAGEAGVAGGAGSQTRQLQGGPVPAVPRAARGVMPRPRALQVPAPAQPTPLRYGMPSGIMPAPAPEPLPTPYTSRTAPQVHNGDSIGT